MAEQQSSGTGEQTGGTGIGAEVFLGSLAVLLGLIAILFGSAALSGPSIAWGPAGGAVAFGLVSALFVLFVYAAGAVRREQRRIAERRAVDPDRPWMWSDEWREGRFRATATRTTAAVMLVFALIWDVVTIGGMWLVNARAAWDAGTVIWAVLFTGAGLFLTGYAIYGLLQQWKYSPAVLHMETVPGVLGGRMKGHVQVPEQVVAGADAAVSVRCERICKRGRSSTVLRLWEDRAHLVVPSSRAIAVDFTIPFDVPSSEVPGSSPVNPIRWRLSVNAAMPGVDYDALFDELPVFATAASDPSIVRGVIAPSETVGRPPDAKTRVVEDTSDRTVFALPPVKGVTVTLAVVVLLPVVTWLIARSVSTEAGAVTIATAVAALAALGILGLMCLGIAMTPAAIEIDGDGVDVLRGTGPLRSTRTIRIEDIIEIKYTTGQVGGSVEAVTAGKAHTVATLQQVDEAKWLAAAVSSAVARHRSRGEAVATHRQGSA